MIGDTWWQQLPEMYRVADAKDVSTADAYPLREYLRSAAAGLDDTLDVADRVENLTDGMLADDEWVPWLAQVTGVRPAATLADTRVVIASKRTAAQPGTPEAVVALARTWLSGTQVCDLVPASAPWTLVLRVKASEILDPSPEALAARLLASGLLPAGFTVNVQSGAPTWDAVETASGGTWDGIDSFEQWRNIDSIGVTGV